MFFRKCDLKRSYIKQELKKKIEYLAVLHNISYALTFTIFLCVEYFVKRRKKRKRKKTMIMQNFFPDWYEPKNCTMFSWTHCFIIWISLSKSEGFSSDLTCEGDEEKKITLLNKKRRRRKQEYFLYCNHLSRVFSHCSPNHAIASLSCD